MPQFSSLAGAFRRRPKVNIVAFTVTVLVAVAVLITADLWWRRERVLKAADTRAQNLSSVLSEYIRGSFTSADAALRQLAVHGQRAGGPAVANDTWDALLDAAKAALPENGSISVTDRTGTITHSTIRRIVGQQRGDSYVFKRLAAGGPNALILDRPFLSTATPGQFIIPVGRPLTTADGTFDGIVVATVLPEAYREFFKTLDVGPGGGVISVLHPDGVVMFREPSDVDPMNAAVKDDPILAQARQQPIGLLHAPLVADGRPYISAYRAIGQPPVVVAVSLSQDGVLEDWRRQRRVTAAAYGALTLTLVAMVMALFRLVNARTRAERELYAVQEQEAGRLRESNERLEAALERERRARKETETASYLKDEFLMTVSHELRTPLTAIYGWARVLGTKTMEPPQQARAIAAIERNAHAQTRLIDDLLDVSRAISGKLRLDSRPINVADVLRAAVETVSPAMAAKRITFETDLDPETPVIMADPDRVQQIAWNLLSNAIKFTPDGGTVRLTLARTDTQVEIVVCDTGGGIEAEFLPYVFERFRQGDAGSKRRYGGLGLGLAIVRHLVELHGGTVTAESPGEGRGATFRVSLPVNPIRADEGAERAPAKGSRPRAATDRLDGIRVLVVDDEVDARELFGSILDSAGASVVTAASAAAALHILAEEPVDVLISDIEMPGEDGYHLLAQATALRKGEPLIAIAVTAYARTVDRRRALEAGFNWHLAKPIEPAELVSIVASLKQS